MFKRLTIAFAVLLLIAIPAVAGKKVPGVPVFIGSNDTSGVVLPEIEDSKKDLAKEFTRLGYVVVPSAEQAKLRVIILSRETINLTTGSRITRGIFGGLVSQQQQDQKRRVTVRFEIGDSYRDDRFCQAQLWSQAALCLAKYITPIVLANLDKVK